jgi:hypothetical protein
VDAIANRSAARGYCSQSGRGSWTGRRPGSGGPLRLVGSCGSPRRRAVGLRLPLRRAACGPCVRPCGTTALALLSSNHAPWLHLSGQCRCWCGRRESLCSVFCNRTEQAGCYGGGGEESTGTSKPSVVETKVALRFGSKASLALEGRMVPSHERGFQ